ncbi:hypothetical protein IBE10_09085 [Francisella tularensis subsp. novicida]|uniref:hypothetical protein n=1 Tax=Francisella tularensis TaxID=263 RepID=UPI0008FD8DF0|nr:hypothetical protein [Francisella tularensis]APC96191.1 hypothetical protein KX02_1844 [Francisella tularensis subsp. novicida]MBK2347069.1 hypothetical protein [Francisella tularensis subsp. novicida]
MKKYLILLSIMGSAISLYAAPNVIVHNNMLKDAYISLNSSASVKIRTEESKVVNLKNYNLMGNDILKLTGADKYGNKVEVGEVWMAKNLPVKTKCTVLQRDSKLASGEKVDYCLVLNTKQPSVELVVNFSKGEFSLKASD